MSMRYARGMCNLYQPAPGAVEHVISSMRGLFDIPGFDPDKPVGPFDRGIFIRPKDGALVAQVGQWGMIKPGSPQRIQRKRPRPNARPGTKGEPLMTNNARYEGIETRKTYMHAWHTGQRCLVAAAWYQEPNWETGKHIPWQLRRADGRPWWLGGLWEEWSDPETGEIVPNFTVITQNCTGHGLLGRLHQPDKDPVTKEVLPPDKQDKRSVLHIDPDDWTQWLEGSEDQARALIKLQPPEVFDQADARRTDEALAALRGGLF